MLEGGCRWRDVWDWTASQREYQRSIAYSPVVARRPGMFPDGYGEPDSTGDGDQGAGGIGGGGAEHCDCAGEADVGSDDDEAWLFPDM